MGKLVNTYVMINGVPILRGAMHYNARNPDSPEFGKALKIENIDWSGRGEPKGNLGFQNFSSDKRIITNKKNRSDFV